MATSTHTFPDPTQEKLKRLRDKTGISINAWLIIAVNELLRKKESEGLKLD